METRSYDGRNGPDDWVLSRGELDQKASKNTIFESGQCSDRLWIFGRERSQETKLGRDKHLWRSPRPKTVRAGLADVCVPWWGPALLGFVRSDRAGLHFLLRDTRRRADHTTPRFPHGWHGGTRWFMVPVHLRTKF